MKYYIEYSLTSNLSGPVNFRQEYETKLAMLKDLRLFQGAGYVIDDYGEI